MSKTAPRSTKAKASTPRRGQIDGVIKRLERMLESGDLSDVQFSIGRDVGPVKILNAHKFVLSSASDVFYIMFNGSLPENRNGPIDIPDIPPQAFQNMLKYIYTSEKQVTLDDVYATMQCADNPIPTASGTYVHCKELFKMEEFSELQPSTLRTILERDTLFANENLICVAVDRWAVAACTRGNLEPTPANRREVLGEMFYLIRFPVMTVMQVADLPADNGLLEASALVEMRHHKHRFPTRPRRLPVIRIGGKDFRHKEEIFFKRQPNWRPAAVIGKRGSSVFIRSKNSSQVYLMPTRNLIRASDILTANQHVRLSIPGSKDRYKEARYVRLEGGYHIVKVGRKEQKVKFRQVFVEHERVETWKKASDQSSNRKKDTPLTKKRKRDAADSHALSRDSP
ncbi:BTB/POZ domain-containing protein 2-like [Paramacrobiotus metropolitanus]|uniref:BTB/POZ domain-containing protein 2-like n=1 Tax=Paramacrobiotus metropolitanus TaxID=2943436 RepID=UPI0024464DCE|nr:BTB/POZ domain-containing protein 2-like [Paramacrobiotus metropolitanus]